MVELPGYIFVSDEVEADVLSTGSPILAQSSVSGEWWIVYRDRNGSIDTMPEYEWPHVPVLRLWDGEKIEYATAE